MAVRPLVRRGSTGPALVELQNLLNTKLVPSPGLNPDGAFGKLTYNAVVRYQTDNWLVIDGVVGPCTWNALLGLENYSHQALTALVPQPTKTTCWKAATAMLLGAPLFTVGNGPATLMSDGSLDNSTSNIEKYANHHGLQLDYGMTWLPQGLASRMQGHGRLMFHIVWNVYAWNPSLPASGHMVVLASIRGDNTAEATTMVFLDPWSPNVGEVVRMTYTTLLKRVPGATANVFYK
jgi:hypothetical protein